jgi:hypothetical protein
MEARRAGSGESTKGRDCRAPLRNFQRMRSRQSAPVQHHRHGVLRLRRRPSRAAPNKLHRNRPQQRTCLSCCLFPKAADRRRRRPRHRELAPQRRSCRPLLKVAVCGPNRPALMGQAQQLSSNPAEQPGLHLQPKANLACWPLRANLACWPQPGLHLQPRANLACWPLRQAHLGLHQSRANLARLPLRQGHLELHHSGANSPRLPIPWPRLHHRPRNCGRQTLSWSPASATYRHGPP